MQVRVDTMSEEQKLAFNKMVSEVLVQGVRIGLDPNNSKHFVEDILRSEAESPTQVIRKLLSGFSETFPNDFIDYDPAMFNDFLMTLDTEENKETA